MPATTLVQLGPRLRRPPPHRATLQGCAEMHSSGAIADLPPLSFHASAVALPEEGGELEFVAGAERGQGRPKRCARWGTACASAMRQDSLGRTHRRSCRAAWPAPPPTLHFAHGVAPAGDTARGARILYDILPDGRRLYALTIVQSIYRLGDEVGVMQIMRACW